MLLLDVISYFSDLIFFSIAACYSSIVRSSSSLVFRQSCSTSTAGFYRQRSPEKPWWQFFSWCRLFCRLVPPDQSTFFLALARWFSFRSAVHRPSTCPILSVVVLFTSTCCIIAGTRRLLQHLQHVALLQCSERSFLLHRLLCSVPTAFVGALCFVLFAVEVIRAAELIVWCACILLSLLFGLC